MTFSRPIPVAVVLSSVLAAWAFSDERQNKPVGQQIHGEARRILGLVQQSKYSHKTFVDEENGIFYLDCSGFVDLVLKKVSPKHLANIETRRGKGKRQLAEDYVEAFEQSPTTADGPWRRIVRIPDAQPGDILCWINPKHQEGDHLNTGHVMIIAEPPTPETHRGQTLYRVTVIDSTSSPHGGDTRKEGATGLGCGTLRLSADLEGKPIGYRWKSPSGQLHESAVVIGRAMGGD